MTSVNVTTTKNTVTVNGETRVVTVKTAGPQGPAFADGDIGDIVISGGGTVATIDAGAVNNAKIASNAAIDLTKLATGALPTAITVTSANISDLSIVDADISGSAAISLSKLATGALPTGITISSANIPDLTIVNSDVSASAAIEGSKLQASSGSNSGTMSAANFTKLAGVETGATADQTKSDIDALGIAASTAATLLNARTIAGTSFDGSANIDISYANLTNKLSVGDGGLTQNNFTDALKTKLDGIETAATADQTAAEIKTLLNSDGIVNAQIDASAAIAGAKISPDFGSQNITTTGNLNAKDIVLTDTAPLITFNDSNNESDFVIGNLNGTFIIQDTDVPVNRFTVATGGQTTISGNLDCGAGVDITGDLTVSGNMTVSGTTTTIDTTTLTVEDKNIELGKVSTPTDTTADGGGITLKGATDKTFNWIDATDSWTSSEHIALPDNKKLQLGNSQDLQIYHDSNNSFISDTGTGNLNIDAGTILNIRNANSVGQRMARFTATDSVELFYNASRKFATSSTGATVTGSLAVTDALIHDGDTDTKIAFSTNNIDFQTGGLSRLNINSSGTFKIVAPNNNTGEQTPSFQWWNENSAGIMAKIAVIREAVSAAPGALAFYTSDNVDTSSNNGEGNISEKLRITSGGNVQIPNDNAKLQIGASQDLELFHDGSTSRIVSDAHALMLNTTTFVLKNAAFTEDMITAASDGAVSLYFDGSKKFETTSDGATITGNLKPDADSTRFLGSNGVRFSKVFADVYEGSGANLTGINTDLVSDTSPQLGGDLQSNGNDILIADNDFIKFGTGNDLRIRHDATGGNHSYIFHHGTGVFKLASDTQLIIGKTSNEDFIKCIADGAVELYHDNSKKLETHSTGGNVTGSLGINTNSPASTIDARATSGATITARNTGTAASISMSVGSSTNQLVSRGVNSSTARDLIFMQGTTTAAKIDTNNNFLIPNDNARLQIGASQDLQLLHNGSDSFVRDLGTGGLYLTGSVVGVRNSGANEDGLLFTENAAVSLYFDNSKKLETTSTGVSVTGDTIGTGKLQYTHTGVSNTAHFLFEGTQSTGTNNNGTFFEIKHGRGAGNTNPILDVKNNVGSVFSVAGTGDITGTGNLTLTSTDAGSSAAPELELYRNSASPADADYLGQLKFTGESDDGSKEVYAKITGKISDASSGTEDGIIEIAHRKAGSNNISARFTSEALKLINGTALEVDGTDATINSITVGKGTNSVAGNTVLGESALDAAVTGINNTAIGKEALTTNTSGQKNVAVGNQSLKDNTTGDFNVALGAEALFDNTSGSNNTATGFFALGLNTTGSNNVAMGFGALDANTTGANNVAVGKSALSANTTASNNTAVGKSALGANTTGTTNVAVGTNALYSNTTANSNIAVGTHTLYANTTGASNVGVGHAALRFNTTASNNTGLGFNALYSNTTGTNNVAVGKEALDANTTGSQNLAIGSGSLGNNTTADLNTAVGYLSMKLNTTGNRNTALGGETLEANTDGDNNVAVGFKGLEANTTGFSNVAVGRDSLKANTTGSENLAVGANALDANTTASHNTALGKSSLTANTTGAANTATGSGSMTSTTTGSDNVAVGTSTLFDNTTGANNTAIGRSALENNTTASNNTAVGKDALLANTTGTQNVAVGGAALTSTTTGSFNTAVGHTALDSNTVGTMNVAVGTGASGSVTEGDENTAIGFQSGNTLTTGSNNTSLGYQANASSATSNNQVTLGNSSIATLRCNVQTISSLSDARDKTNVIDLPEGLDFISKLRPVKFEWATRDGNGKDGSFEHGFIAQDLQTAQKENNADYLNMVMDENPDRLEASYGKLVPILVKAIQELTMEVNKLKSNG